VVLWRVRYKLSLRDLTEQEPEPLQAAIDGGWVMGLLMDEVGAKRRQVHGLDLGEAGRAVLIYPREPGVKALEIRQIGANRGRG